MTPAENCFQCKVIGACCVPMRISLSHVLCVYRFSPNCSCRIRSHVNLDSIEYQKLLNRERYFLRTIELAPLHTLYRVAAKFPISGN